MYLKGNFLSVTKVTTYTLPTPQSYHLTVSCASVLRFVSALAWQGGVVLAADTRATGGKTVCDRNCDKIHILASNIACCGAGTSADAVRVTEVRTWLKLTAV